VGEGQRSDFIPFVFQQMLKFDRILRTYPPAVSTPGTSGHVVAQGPLITNIR
jgi:hypothetical protein